MKLFYVSSQFVQERQPAGMIQMFYTSREFRKILGDDFKLVVRGVEDKFLMDQWRLGYEVSRCPFRARIIFYIFWMPVFWARQKSGKENKVLYCLDWHVAIAGILYKKFFGYKIAVEYHDPPFGSWKDWIITRFCDYLLPTTQAMGNYLVATNKLAQGKIFVASNGIDIDKFNISNKESSREVLGLPIYSRIVLYSGNLVARKGIYTLLESAGMIEGGAIVMFVGRSDYSVLKDLKDRAKGNPNIQFKGDRPHEEIPLWLKAADVVVAPNSQSAETSQGIAAIKWTSPMKVFEYMSSRRPMVVSDIPAMRELLDDSMAVFVEPDNPKALAEGIDKLLSDKEKVEEITKNAYDKVKNLTWEKRAEAILDFIKQ